MLYQRLLTAKTQLPLSLSNLRFDLVKRRFVFAPSIPLDTDPIGFSVSLLAAVGDVFKAPPATIGILLSSVSVAITITSAQLGKLSKHYQPTTLIRASFILYAVALSLVPFMPSIWFLLIPTTIFGIGSGIGFPSIQTLLADLAPREYLATILSVNGTFFGLGQTLGPLLMGIVFGLGGISSVFYAGVGFAIFIFFVFRYCTCL